MYLAVASYGRLCYLASTGGVLVTLSNTSASNASADSNIGCAWRVTFPVAAGDPPKLGIDGAALKGRGAAGNVLELQSARVPEIQRISTLASSGVSGWFTIEFGEEQTVKIGHNASAEEVRRASDLT